jgi:alcohol dehydrogenase (cytochrome c)
MKHSKILHKLGAVLIVGIIGLLPVIAAAQIQNYAPVTDQRLQNPEPENWLISRANYAGWGYSPLDKINTENVKKLTPVWTLSTGVIEGHEAPPIVNNGVMFVSTPQNQVIAIEAKSGDVLWIYKKQIPDDLFQLHPTNRAVSLYDDKVYMATVDTHVVALDAKTGKVVWDKTVDDYHNGYYFTIAPLIVKGKVMVGTSGGELAIRGYITALDAKTGDALWKTYTVPGPGEPGSETWSGEAWKNGGGSVWIQGTYDPELNLAYFGVGNAAPWAGDFHPGDNLYTTSTVAVEPETGKIKAHFQYHWNDSWDWDEITPPLLIDVESGGKTIKALVHPARNGYLWILERSKDKISYVTSKAFVKQDVFKSIDPKTGRPEYIEERKPGRGKLVPFCPSLWGGKDWQAEAYSPTTKLLYIPSNDNHCGSLKSKEKEDLKPGQLYLGVEVKDIKTFPAEGAKTIADLQAWDLSKMERVWSHKYEGHTFAGVLATGGDLVFHGGTNDRFLHAFDAKTGKVLWSFRTNSGIMAPPISFMVDGVQYIAVQSGWGVDAERMQGALIDTGYKGKYYNKDIPIIQGGVIWVFALGQ